MSSIFKRVGWILLAVLFLGTGLGVGVVAFWQATHQKKDTSPTVGTSTTPPTQQLKGTQLSGFTPVDKIDSLQKIDTKVGNGAEAKASSTVTVQYTGAVAATGKIFQSSFDTGQPLANYSINGFIQGWQQGLLGMKVGGERRLLVPAAQAYGANSPSPDIPANADLVFDIILLDVK